MHLDNLFSILVVKDFIKLVIGPPYSQAMSDCNFFYRGAKLGEQMLN